MPMLHSFIFSLKSFLCAMARTIQKLVGLDPPATKVEDSVDSSGNIISKMVQLQNVTLSAWDHVVTA